MISSVGICYETHMYVLVYLNKFFMGILKSSHNLNYGPLAPLEQRRGIQGTRGGSPLFELCTQYALPHREFRMRSRC